MSNAMNAMFGHIAFECTYKKNKLKKKAMTTTWKYGFDESYDIQEVKMSLHICIWH